MENQIAIIDAIEAGEIEPILNDLQALHTEPDLARRALARWRNLRSLSLRGSRLDKRLDRLADQQGPPEDIGSRRFTIWQALREGRGLPDGPVDDTDPNAHTDSDEDEDVGMDASGAERPDRAAGTPSGPAAGRHSA